MAKTISVNDLGELFAPSTHFGIPQLYAPIPFAFRREGTGSFTGNVTMLPDIEIESTVIAPDDNLLVTDYSPIGDIDINFQLKGHLYSEFYDVKHPLNMLPGKHNLLFAPDSKSTHKVSKGDVLQGLHISIKTDYFLRMLGEADEFTEAWAASILRLKAFTGTTKPQTITTPMLRAINDIMACQWTGVMRKLYLESKVIELLVMEIEQFKQQQTSPIPAAVSTDIDKLKDLKALLDRNFLDEYTVYDLVKTTSLNEFKLKTGFKQLYNVSVFAYIKQLRMQHAYQLLTDNNMKVEEVSEVLGYNHAHHFSAAFKKHFGKTPSSVKE